MKSLVFFPSDPIGAYLDLGWSIEQLQDYYNPAGYFDEIYCLSPWEPRGRNFGKMNYICARPHQFKSIIEEIHPTTVRGYGGYCCADWVAISKVKDIPTVISVHDTNPDILYDSINCADIVLCMSSVVRELVLNKTSLNPENVWILPNRVDTDLFSRKTDQTLFSELNKRFGAGKHILHVGRKVEQKNLDTLIKAMSMLENDQHCIFVGKGDTDKYKVIAEQYGVAERCHFVDSVPNVELPIWYSWADCMCTPSRWEGFGVVFIEAAACEAAIVTSDIAPMNEYLTNNVNAILLKDYENPESIARAILEAEEKNEKVKSMRKAAREVGLRFSKQIVDEQEAEIYQEVECVKCNNKILDWRDYEEKYIKYK